MGGGSYDRDVGYSSSSGSFYSGGSSSASAKKALGRRSAHEDLTPYQRKVISLRECPIVVALDVTGSNIGFARIVYDKAPMLHGQIEQQGYLKDFDICFTAVGDATSDRAPLQVCDFDYGKSLDKHLKKLYLEANGGGGIRESYELAAHYFGKKCDMPNAKMPFFFFIGDEKPYSKLEARIANSVLGEKRKNPLKTETVFKNLYKQFQGNVFFLQNPLGGYTGEVTKAWAGYMGKGNAEKIIPIIEEKSVVDVILGTIAMVSKVRDMETYKKDMKNRGQTKKRME